MVCRSVLRSIAPVFLLQIGVTTFVSAQSASSVEGTGIGDSGPPLNTSSRVAPTGLEAWKNAGIGVLSDQKKIWTFPLQPFQGKHLKPTIGFVAATAGLVALDPHDTPYFQRTTSFGTFNKVFASRKTGIGITAFPAALYLVGLGRRDAYGQQTAILSAQALANAQLVTLVIKSSTRRLRPRDIPPGGDMSQTWFQSPGPALSSRASFPSGHALTAFSVATVVACRYPRPRWIPWVAYGLAGAVGFSRVSLRAHFPSDVFAGAFLGTAMTKYVVLRPR